MFIKNLKLKAIFLAVVMIGLGVISGKAEDPTYLKITDEEIKVDIMIKIFMKKVENSQRYKSTVLILKQIFDEKASQRAEWLKCCSLGTSPENGHPELYYLWLKEKYEGILPEFALDADRGEEIKLFIMHLTNAVEETHSRLPSLYEFRIYTLDALLNNLRDGLMSGYDLWF